MAALSASSRGAASVLGKGRTKALHSETATAQMWDARKLGKRKGLLKALQWEVKLG